MVVVAAVTLWCVFGVIGGTMGDRKGQKAGGFWLGFLLGPIGLALVLFMPQTGPTAPTTTCQFCGACCDSSAVTCDHCHQWV